MEELIKLYIVDDEKMAIDYFKKLTEAISPSCKVVGEALHGPTALEEIPKVQPDIVFVDISMPVMNGLVLAEQILKQNRNQNIVFLTSYREFDYVKKGMELGVSRYLLKNELTAESLSEEIKGIMDQIRLEKMQLHTYQEHNLKQFLESESGTGEGLQNIYRGSNLNRYGLIVIKKMSPICTQTHFSDHLQFESIVLEKQDYPEGLTCRGAVRMSEEIWATVFFIHELVSDSSLLLEDAAQKIQGAFAQTNGRFSIVISDITKNFTDLPQIYKRIARLSQHMLCMGAESVYRQKELEQALTDAAHTDFYMSDLVLVLDEEKRTEAEQLVTQLFEETRTYTVQEFTRMLLELHGVIRRYGIRKKVDVNVFPTQSEFYSVEEAKAYTLKLITTVFSHLHEQEENQYSRNVIMILDYIQKHYAENISLQDIAEAVQLSEGHARKCFKQEVGTTVVDYLTEYRIKRAKELIKSGERITSVYEKAGFTSSQYFSYVFKKNEGISPSEYARKSR